MKNRALLLCVLAVPALAAAADGDDWYVTQFLGGITPDYHREVDRTSVAYGAAIGRELGPIFNMELSGNGGFDVDTHRPLPPGHLNLDALSLDMLAVANRGGIITPYIGLGLGAVRADYKFNGGVDPGYDTRLGVETEAGLMIRIWRSSDQTGKLALRPEIKMRWADPGNSNFKDYLYTVGIQYSFGGSSVAAPIPVAAEAPPSLPPPPAAPSPPSPPPPPQPPLDSDHDGVPDSIDRCPNTPSGVQVDAVGCPLTGSITLEGVNFAFNKSDLTVQSRPILDSVASGLGKHPRVKVEIQGHTDSVGSPAYNRRLSQRRAQTVRDYLISAGVSADRLKAKGYGESQPIASNKDDAGRAKNRRVVMYVLSNPGDVNVKAQGTAQDGPGQPGPGAR